MLPQLRHVPLLVAPLDPPWRRAQRVDEDEGVDPLRVLERVPDHDVAAQADAEPDVPHDREVVDDFVELLRHLVQRGVLERLRQGVRRVLLAGRVHVEDAEAGGCFNIKCSLFTHFMIAQYRRP